MAAEISGTSSAIEHSSTPGTNTGVGSHSTIYNGIPMVISGHKLGSNYLSWSKAIKMFITRKGTEDYLFGAIKPPAVDDLKYKGWKTGNNMIMSWLIGSMASEISENFLLYFTADEIWSATKEMYPRKIIPWSYMD